MIFYTTFITWTASTTEAMVANIHDIISDLTPLLTIVLAIGVGLIIFSVIISAIRGHN